MTRILLQRLEKDSSPVERTVELAEFIMELGFEESNS